MDFLSMLPAIKGDAQVESFYGTFYCQRCDDEFSVLVKTENIAESQTAPCPKCSQTASAIGYLEDFLREN